MSIRKWIYIAMDGYTILGNGCELRMDANLTLQN